MIRPSCTVQDITVIGLPLTQARTPGSPFTATRRATTFVRSLRRTASNTPSGPDCTRTPCAVCRPQVQIGRAPGPERGCHACYSSVATVSLYTNQTYLPIQTL